MSRPTAVDLTVPHDRWREIPMPGSGVALQLVRLDAPNDTLAMYARFPAGFERATRGGYDVPEEFVVVDGELVLEGVTLRRGDLTYVPERKVRRGMSSEIGCTVLAWFGGPAEFRPEADLDPFEAPTQTVSVLDAPHGVLLDVPPATWSVLTCDAATSVDDDVIDLYLRGWSRGGSHTDGSAPLLVRRRGQR